jgi:tRNA nucleotidyltransferase (CCA-adding enzyme)
VLKDGELRLISPGHEVVSGTLAENFLNRVNAPRAIIERVLPLVRSHMAHMEMVTDRAVRRLAKRLEPENIQGLCVVMTADAMGRPPKPPRVPDVVNQLLAKAAELQVQASAPKPILMGRHLLELGMKPGPAIGAILEEAYNAQLEGAFFDLSEALQWLATRDRSTR